MRSQFFDIHNIKDKMPTFAAMPESKTSPGSVFDDTLDAEGNKKTSAGVSFEEKKSPPTVNGKKKPLSHFFEVKKSPKVFTTDKKKAPVTFCSSSEAKKAKISPTKVEVKEEKEEKKETALGVDGKSENCASDVAGSPFDDDSIAVASVLHESEVILDKVTFYAGFQIREDLLKLMTNMGLVSSVLAEKFPSDEEFEYAKDYLHQVVVDLEDTLPQVAKLCVRIMKIVNSMARSVNIDLRLAVLAKMKINCMKYPVQCCKGNPHRKYTAYSEVTGIYRNNYGKSRFAILYSQARDYPETLPTTPTTAAIDCAMSQLGATKASFTNLGHFKTIPSQSDMDALFANFMKTGKMIIQSFVDEREWHGFYKPRNVLFALMGEVGELSAALQELDDKAITLNIDQHNILMEEMADVTIYALHLWRIVDEEHIPMWRVTEKENEYET